MVRRGRPKGSKNKPKNAFAPLEDAEHTIKYGNPKFRERDPERDLDGQEITFLIARYQETDGSMKQAAKYVCVSENNARKHIWAEAEKNPRILTDPKFLLASGTTLLEVADECMEAYRRILRGKDLRGANLLSSADYAKQRGHKVFAAYVDKKAASGAIDNMDQAKEAVSELDDELQRLEGGTGDNNAKSPQAGVTTTDAVGQDAGQGDERT